MNGKSLALICIALVAVALIVAPVSAMDATGEAAVIGNPSAYVSISVNLSTLVMGDHGIMEPGGLPTTNESLGITVSANKNFQITVADNTAGKGHLSHIGYMSNYTSTYVEIEGLNTALAAPLELAGTTNSTGSTTTAKDVEGPITATPQDLYEGLGAVTNQLLAPNVFSQTVATTDPVLPTGSTYRSDLIFTITAT